LDTLGRIPKVSNQIFTEMGAPIHPKLAIHPILLPQMRFTDMFGKPNAYLEMNPAMYIEPSGRARILVRCVNYRKFHDKQFTLYEPKSNSKYILLTGNFSHRHPLNLEEFTAKEIQYSYDRQTYPTYWTGLEDIRFVDEKTVLVTIPELNPTGNPCIFRAELDSSSLRKIQPCLPNSVPEKNWMPFSTESGNSQVIYSLSPFMVKSLDSDDKREIPVSNEIQKALAGYHGSTNGIPYGSEEILFLIHGNREKSYHRWLRFNPVTNKIHVSPEFTFFRDSYIEFPCSISIWNHVYYIGLGVNDDKAFILEVSKYTVQGLSWSC
jgi:hypothetical protein